MEGQRWSHGFQHSYIGRLRNGGGEFYLHTHTKVSSQEDEGSDRGAASLSQGMPKTSSKPLEARGEEGQLLPHSH